MANLKVEAQIYVTLKARMMETFSLEEDSEVLRDTLDGMSPLSDIILNMIRTAKRSEAFAEGIKTIMADNKARKERLEIRAAKLRDLASWAMLECGLSKIEESDITISRRVSNPSVVITDEAAVPLEFCRVKTEPDKTKIKEAMDRGEHLAFAAWSNPHPILIVHTK